MNLQINCTADGIKKYPMHKHSHYEIMLYTKGNGYLRTLKENYPFSPGSIIIVPPGTEHGSVSENGFKNISIGGDFAQLLHFDKPVVLTDNIQSEGRLLAEMIYNNRHKNNDYLCGLCTAYLYFLLENLNIEDNVNAVINNIVTEITDNFSDCSINLASLLRKSGYAEDYARSLFKKLTGKTPSKFLTDIRIKHACFLIDIYKNTLSLGEIAERCGYTDYVYFSKQFKLTQGVSPRQYKNEFK